MIPWINPDTSVLTTVDENGVTHRHHLDQQEGEQFFSLVECLATGRDELGMLLGNAANPEGLTEEQLHNRWFAKVTGAGLSHEQAADFLTSRLARQEQP